MFNPTYTEEQSALVDTARKFTADTIIPAAHACDEAERFPVEINRAPREDLLRVPGLGPRAVAAILAARAGGRLREPAHLRQLGIAANGALPWITLDGRRAARQLELPLRDLPRAPRPT